MPGDKKNRIDVDTPEEGIIDDGEMVAEPEKPGESPASGGEADIQDDREPEVPSLEKFMDENEELKNRMLYLHAELDNFKKRSAKEKEQLLLFGNERLIKELIPLLDNLELAINHGREDDNSRQFVSGIELIYNEFLNILKRFGVTQLDEEGEEFDPNFHEAVSSINVPDKEPGTIYQVVRKGYTLNRRLLRPVQVIITAGPDRGNGGDDGTEENKVN